MWRSSRSLQPDTLMRFITREPHREMLLPSHLANDLVRRATQESIRQSNGCAMKMIWVCVKVLFAATIVLWEVAIAYHLFEKQSAPVALSIQGLPRDQLEKYIVPRGGVAEYVFRRTGKYSSPGKCCWQHAHGSVLTRYVSFPQRALE